MKLLRVADKERWKYTPADPKDMRMFSDAGPLTKSPNSLPTVAANIASSFKDGKLTIRAGYVSVGNQKDADYNDFIDLSYEKAPVNGIRLSDIDGNDGEIVIAMNAKNGELIPAMLSTRPGPRIEFAEEPEENTRFFVFREDGSLLSVSYETQGEEVRLIPRMAMASWLASRSGQELRFSVYTSNGKTKIKDAKRDRIYVINSQLSDDDMDEVYYMANTNGIGSLVSKYKLRKEV